MSNEKLILVIKVCCINCHYYFSSYENCQGLNDVENDYCHEYKETLYKIIPQTKYKQ